MITLALHNKVIRPMWSKTSALPLCGLVDMPTIQCSLVLCCVLSVMHMQSAVLRDIPTSFRPRSKGLLPKRFRPAVVADQARVSKKAQAFVSCCTTPHQSLALSLSVQAQSETTQSVWTHEDRLATSISFSQID